MKKVEKIRSQNAADGHENHEPRPLALHLLATSMLLSAAAFPWVSDPEHRDAAQRAVRDLAQQMLTGLEAYRSLERTTEKKTYKHIWECGSAKLLQIPAAPQKGAAPVLLVPSLINRYGILDLEADHSFARFLNARGFEAYILDWGPPLGEERAFTVNDYILRRLYPVLEMLRREKTAPHVIGYCMGGTMAAGALAARDGRRDLARSLTLLAAPWDFHAGDRTLPSRMAAFITAAAPVMEATGTLPVDWIQAMFASVDPLFAFNKFRSFAAMDKTGDSARRFVKVEDWLNDGVDLAAPAARQALEEWYVDNQPRNGVWTIGTGLAEASRIDLPVFVAAAGRDRLVPKESALAIMQQIDACEGMEADIGHIGMMASPRAPGAVWGPVADWLARR